MERITKTWSENTEFYAKHGRVGLQVRAKSNDTVAHIKAALAELLTGFLLNPP